MAKIIYGSTKGERRKNRQKRVIGKYGMYKYRGKLPGSFEKNK